MICQTFSQLTVFFSKETKGAIGVFHDRTPRRELQNVEEQLAAPQAPVPVMGTADTVQNGGSM